MALRGCQNGTLDAASEAGYPFGVYKDGRHMKAWMIIGALVGIVSLASCGHARKSGLCEDLGTDKARPGDLAATEAAAEAAWKGRIDQAKLVEAIAKWREAVAIAPKKTENHVKLSRALYLLGDGYLRFADGKNEEMLKALEDAVFFAEQALKIQNPDFQFSICAGEPFEKSVKTIRKQDVPAVYWYATALGKYGLAKSIVVVLDNKDRIFAMMNKVKDLDRGYFHGAPDRYLGAFYTKIPFPKGDLKKSRAHFEESLKRAPDYVATHVLVAELLAPKLKDRELFKKHLDFTLAAKDDILPGLEAEVAIEKRKAKALMEDIDTLFPPTGADDEE